MMSFPRAARRRIVGASLAIPLCFARAAFAGAADEARNPHQEALKALSDIDAAIAALSSASRVTATNAEPYKQQAQRAAEALAGSGSHATGGTPGDPAGAIAHLSWLSAHAGETVWGPAVQGALVNLQVAEGHLSESAKADGLEEFWSATSDALQSLLVAAGRPSEPGVLGGLRGVLSTTDLGVPPGARVVSGCAAPAEAPAYGVVKGYLSYVAVPRDEGTTRLPETLGVRDVSVRGNAIILHTAAVDPGGKLCADAQTAGTMPVPKDPPGDPKSGDLKSGGAKSADASSADAKSGDEKSADAKSADARSGDKPGNTSGDVAALYTEQQAEQGKAIFDGSCSSCHGNHLQGSASAPPIGGAAFLKKAKMLEWKVADMRNMVVSAMPANNPGSLSPEQYADVLAYVLAVNCYPAGSKPFPTGDTPALSQTTLHQIQGAKGEDSKNNTCPVKE
jgi:polar amino acid transport system substrate-binding protein